MTRPVVDDGARARITYKVGLVLGSLGMGGSILCGILQAMHGRDALRWLLLAPILGGVQFLLGTYVIGPSLIRRGFIAPDVARSQELEGSQKQDGKAVTSASARMPWLAGALWALSAGAVIGASAKGVAGLPTVLAAFALSGLGEYVVSAISDRKGRALRTVPWKIEDGTLHVEGERPVRLAEISAAVRSDDGAPTLLVLNRRGRVALRLTGSPDVLDEIRDGLRLERMSLPVARDPRVLIAVLAPLLVAIIAAFGAPKSASTFYGVVASMIAMWPLLRLRMRSTVDVGIDGIVLEGRYVAFAEIESLTAVGEQLDVVEKSGKRTSVALAHAGSAREVARRWAEHLERAEGRDESEVVRRRIAIEDEAEDMPYRARIASPEELGDALLDSAEARSVRVRAARRLARDGGEAATRVREEVEESVVDPEVRKELGRS